MCSIENVADSYFSTFLELPYVRYALSGNSSFTIRFASTKRRTMSLGRFCCIKDIVKAACGNTPPPRYISVRAKLRYSCISAFFGKIHLSSPRKFEMAIDFMRFRFRALVQRTLSTTSCLTSQPLNWKRFLIIVFPIINLFPRCSMKTFISPLSPLGGRSWVTFPTFNIVLFSALPLTKSLLDLINLIKTVIQWGMYC